MQLPKRLRDRLAQEYEFAAKNMRQVVDPRQKLFFFSVTYGEATRVMNMHWDAQLALVYGVTQHTNQVIATRVTAIQAQAEVNVELGAEYWDALADAMDELSAFVRNKEGSDGELLGILTRFYELAYVSTGNGYYLHLKGAIKI